MNNKGWGLAQMLILSSILIIALLIASINSKRLEKNIEGNSTQSTIENKKEETNIDTEINTSNKNDNNNSNNTNNNTQTNTSNNQKFITIEGSMVTSAQKLVSNNSINISNDILIVKDEHLFEQDSDLKTEMDKYNCKGYIKIYNENNNIHYIPYINCNNYITSGYESSYE